MQLPLMGLVRENYSDFTLKVSASAPDLWKGLCAQRLTLFCTCVSGLIKAATRAHTPALGIGHTDLSRCKTM